MKTIGKARDMKVSPAFYYISYFLSDILCFIKTAQVKKKIMKHYA